MRFLMSFIDKATFVLAIIAALAVVMMMVQVSLDVLLDLLFNTPVPGTLTLVSSYYMPLITFLPLAFVERNENHIAVEVVTQFFAPRGQKHLFGWTFLFCCIVCGMLTHATWIEAVDKFHIGSFSIERGVKIVNWPVRFSAPAGYGLMCLLFALKFLAYLLGAKTLTAANPHHGVFQEDIGAKE
ncbi:TRAP transporter small permease [Anianabacter salinae]|uniref:TRAP transporter small permease n=1 Tax=Anianabacter salinae TaxID=2851023 RepID=UPI00225E36C1|nr:TRAP transporter small permease subunit [Anianabacter salinae]MBV0911067.1 TRAP transporter small permease [Anianabacter salinae]